MPRKIISALVAVVFTVCAFSVFTGCYNSAPAPMEKLVGTYKLTKYEYRLETEEENHDYIAEKGITAYLVVRSDGTGYYVYKDNETPLYAEEVVITYEYETLSEETDETDEYGNNIINTITTDNIKSIYYRYSQDITGGGPNGHPGYGWEHLGFDVKNKNLNVRHSPYHGILVDIKTYQTVEYKRIDNATTLSAVEKELGVSLKTAPFPVKRLNGKYVLRSYGFEEEENLFIIADIDVFAMKANVTKVDKDGETTVESDLAFSYKKSDSEENIYEIIIGDETYYAYYIEGCAIRYFFKRYTDGSEYGFYYEPNFDLDYELDLIFSSDAE